MGFTPAAYDALIKKLQDAIAKVASDTNKFVAEVENDYGWIPFIGPMVKDALNRLVKLVDELLQKLAQLLEPAFIPTFLWTFGGTWNTIGGQASGVSSAIASQIQANGDEWQGIAGGAYANGVPGQESAASAISSMAGGVQSACTSLAIAGYTFYMALAVGIAGVIGGLAIAAATGWTGVGAIVGLCVAIGSALLTVATAVGAWLLGIASSTRTLQGMVGPNGSFPGGKWPIATAQ
jgi:hypothetical protein